MSPPPDPSEAVREAAFRLLSARARSHAELRERLARKGFGHLEVRRCLSWLEERGLLDDAAFSRAFTRDRVRFSPRSPSLIRKELQRKGVEEDVAARATEEVLEEEGHTDRSLAEEAARRWVARHSGTVLARLTSGRRDPEGQRARQRLYRYLVRRGFLADAARAGLEAGVEEARRLQP